jgi:glycosyltransferase involved in cell wall biosynthesis
MNRVAIILPAYNETLTIEATIFAFHDAIPDADIWVVDNNSQDDTAKLARKALKLKSIGGGVLFEGRQGKGNAVRRAFHNVDADIYVLADADLTYPAERIHDLIAPIVENRADMVVGDRISGGHYQQENKRPLHNFGNRLVQSLVNGLFGANQVDIMTGYRAFSRLFVKNYPILVEGFEIETDLTLHALDKKFRILEIPIEYKDRPEGSFSKLNTVKDGFRVIWTIARILRFYRPMLFFGVLSLVAALCGLIAAIPVMQDWFREHYIHHVPLAILATGLELTAIVLIAIALILDSIVEHDKRRFEHHLLNESQRYKSLDQ